MLAVEEDVQISSASHLDLGYARDALQRRFQRLRDLSWGVSGFAGQLEGDGKGRVTEARLGRRLVDDILEIEIVEILDSPSQRKFQPLSNIVFHEARL